MEPIFEIKEETKKDKYSKIVITPLVAGFGDTLGTALRRVMLTSLGGASITSVKMANVRHQFSTLKGMKEDVLDFILNLKKVRFVYEGEEPVKLKLASSGAGEVKAGDIKTPAGVTIVNGELVLASMSKGGKLDVEMTLERGIGYLPAEEREKNTIGEFPVDASFTPVVRVNYKVEETRVGRVTNYDKLVLEIWTDGTIEPMEALLSASKILISYFNQVVNPKKVKKEEALVRAEVDFGAPGVLSVEEIGLPTRVANALSRAGFDTVEKLSNAKRSELVRVRNLGEKSVGVIEKALKERGVSLSNA